MSKMQTTVGVSIFVILCTVVVSSVSTAIPHWIYMYESEEHLGLWEDCGKAVSGMSVCSALTDVHDWMKAVRALMIGGTSLFGLSLLQVCIFARDMSIHSRAKGCIFCLISGGILLITAVIVFACKVDLSSPGWYDFAFFLTIATAVVAIFAAVAVIKAENTSKDGYKEIHA